MFDKLFQQRAISYQTIFESGDDIVFGNYSGTYIHKDTVFQVNSGQFCRITRYNYSVI